MLQKLRDDHIHINKALDLLDIRLSIMRAGGSPDFYLMLNVIVYLQDYSEQVHHPMEDAVFSILLKRDAKSGKIIKNLITDHTRMETLTRRLRKSLETLSKDTHASTDELEQDLPILIERLRHHLQVEEKSIYPAIERLITQQDWEDIKPMIPDTDDPVYGKHASNDYKALYEALETAH